MSRDSPQMARYRDTCPIDCKVYVGELGNSGTKHELEEAFGYYGPLRNVWVARSPPGFAFVEFEDPRDARDAVRALDGKTIEDALEAEVASKRRRLRPAKYPDLEKALLTWKKEMRSQGLPLSGPVILAKAADFALQLDYDDFAASDGWLHRSRERYDLVFHAVLG
ncbi:hypothetical protein HPB51_017151 [Rhipicephalus microplus]|uniref:RRM domain-containing protein n=1 Tax=Rhipicephalus microplus TaxID=6941 RepID=A0A9J6DWH5_RHIMP|nr:hypothetical protein HPB51_017151 [Rhipicephalus microplus]